MDKLLLKEYYLLLAEKMVLSREEKEKMVLDLYYTKGYTYKQLTRELRMSPNQLREIIKRHEEKKDDDDDAIANKKKELSLSSKAYKLFYEGRTNVQVATKLDLPQDQVTQFRLEYWRLQGQDKLESLYIETKGKVSRLWELYKELVIKRGMSFKAVANIVDIDLNRLHYHIGHQKIMTHGVNIGINKRTQKKRMKYVKLYDGGIADMNLNFPRQLYYDTLMPLPFSLFFVNPSLCRVTVVRDIEGENRMKELLDMIMKI